MELFIPSIQGQFIKDFIYIHEENNRENVNIKRFTKDLIKFNHTATKIS